MQISIKYIWRFESLRARIKFDYILGFILYKLIVCHPAFIKLKELLVKGIETINNNHGYVTINILYFLSNLIQILLLNWKKKKINLKTMILNLSHKQDGYKASEKLIIYL